MDKENVIIGAALIVVLTGAISAITHDKNPWPTVGAGIGMAALLSVLAAAGEGPAKVASGLAIVSATAVVMYNAPDLFGVFGNLGKGK